MKLKHDTLQVNRQVVSDSAVTICAPIGTSRVAVATLLVNAVQNTDMHVTRNTITGGGSAWNVCRNDAISSDNLECYNTALTKTTN